MEARIYIFGVTLTLDLEILKIFHSFHFQVIWGTFVESLCTALSA